jgi:hypothetical protein
MQRAMNVRHIAMFCPATLYTIFLHQTTSIILKINLAECKHVLIFFTAFVLNIFHSKRNSVRCDQNSVLLCSTAAVIIVVGDNENLIFLCSSRKILKYQTL